MRPNLCGTHDLESNTHPCLWMQAGVVRKKRCDRNYACSSCPFDRALNKVSAENDRLAPQGVSPQGKRARITHWAERLKRLPRANRPCIHHMKGRIGFRLCTNDYQCPTCEFDQYFDDQHTVRAVVTPLDISHIRGFRIPQGYYLHQGHAWAMLEEGPYVRIGMDDFSLRLLGPVDAIEAPLVGKRVRQDEPDTALRKGNKEAMVMSPVSGIVTDINPQLREKGQLAAESPYSDGWVMRVHAENLKEDLKHLMLHAETVDFLDKEVDDLYRLIEAEVGPMATDGGVLAPDISNHLPQVGWNRLAGRFLRT